MEARLLEEIGLTEGETKVYLALLGLGTSTTGALVGESEISASKVYQILDRLAKKGLVGHVLKGGVKHFRATDPKRILDYLAEKEQELQTKREQVRRILPELELKQKLGVCGPQAEIYEGKKGIMNMFSGILDDLKKGEGYCVVGARAGIKSDPETRRFLLRYHEQRAKKGIFLKMLVNYDTDKLLVPTTRVLAEIKVLPPELSTDVQINFYKEKTMIILWSEEPVGFMIRNKEIAQGFKNYFDLLWNPPTRTLHGFEGIKQLCEEVLTTGKDIYLIGANGLLYRDYPEYFAEFESRRLKLGIRRHHLSVESTRGIAFNALSETRVRYLPAEFSSPLVIWVFGNKVAQVLWNQPQTAFVVDNQKIAEDYRKYFDLLWKTAKK